MTTDDLTQKLKLHIDNLQLNERAIKTLNKIKPEDLNDKKDLFPEFLNGFSRSEIIFKPLEQKIELYNHSGFDPSVQTTIGIYIVDSENKWVNNLKPIGYFEYETNIDGVYLNDHLEITERRHNS